MSRLQVWAVSACIVTMVVKSECASPMMVPLVGHAPTPSRLSSSTRRQGLKTGGTAHGLAGGGAAAGTAAIVASVSVQVFKCSSGSARERPWGLRLPD